MNRSRKAFREELRRTLAESDTPAIISDDNGWVLEANEAALAIFNDRDLREKPWFSHFRAISGRGRSIQRYLELVSGAVSGPIPLDLVADGARHPQVVHPATLNRRTLAGENMILTMIHSAVGEPKKRSEEK